MSSSSSSSSRPFRPTRTLAPLSAKAQVPRPARTFAQRTKKNQAPLLRAEDNFPTFVVTKGCTSNEDATKECWGADLSTMRDDLRKMVQTYADKAHGYMTGALQMLRDVSDSNTANYGEEGCVVPNRECYDERFIQHEQEVTKVAVKLLVRLDTMINYESMRTTQFQTPAELRTAFESMRAETMSRELCKHIIVIRDFFMASPSSSVSLGDLRACLRSINAGHNVIDVVYLILLENVPTSHLVKGTWFRNPDPDFIMRAQNYLHWMDQAELHIPLPSPPMQQFLLHNQQDAEEFRRVTPCDFNGFAPTNLVCQEHYCQNELGGYMLRSEIQQHLSNEAKMSLRYGMLDTTIMSDNRANYAHVEEESAPLPDESMQYNDPDGYSAMQTEMQQRQMSEWNSMAEDNTNLGKRTLSTIPGSIDDDGYDYDEIQDEGMDPDSAHSAFWLETIKPRLEAEMREKQQQQSYFRQ